LRHGSYSARRAVRQQLEDLRIKVLCSGETQATGRCRLAGFVQSRNEQQPLKGSVELSKALLEGWDRRLFLISFEQFGRDAAIFPDDVGDQGRTGNGGEIFKPNSCQKRPLADPC